MARASLSRVCDAVVAHASCRMRPEILSSYGLLPERIAAGAVHVAWAPPLVFHALSKRRLAVAVSCPRRPGGLAYHAAIFSRARSRFRDVKDLDGARAAWVDPASLSGYVLARSWLRRNGRDPARTLAREQFLKTHSAVARAVIGGDADIASTYANVDPKTSRIIDAGWSEIGMSTADVHVLTTIGPVPSDAIVVSTRVADPLRDAIRSALGTLTGSALASVRVLFRAERFEPPPAGYLASLEELNEK